MQYTPERGDNLPFITHEKKGKLFLFLFIPAVQIYAKITATNGNVVNAFLLFFIV